MNKQLKGNTYDRAANLALLKLYQFNPPYLNLSVVTSILIKALLALPDSDFTLCLCLLNESILADPIISVIVTGQQHLEMGKFEEFWTEVNTLPQWKSAIKDCTGFREGIRKFMSEILMATYQIIDIHRLEKYLNLDKKTLADYAKTQGWIMQGNNFIQISDGKEILNPSSAPSAPKTVTSTQEVLTYDQLTRIVGQSNEVC